MAGPDVAFASLDPDITERLQPLRGQLGITAFGISLLVLQAGQRMRVHAHECQEEVTSFWRASCRYFSKGSTSAA